MDCRSSGLELLSTFLTVLIIISYVVQSMGIHTARQYPVPSCCCVKSASNAKALWYTCILFLVLSIAIMTYQIALEIACSGNVEDTIQENKYDLTADEERSVRSLYRALIIFNTILIGIPVILGIIAVAMLRRYSKEWQFGGPVIGQPVGVAVQQPPYGMGFAPDSGYGMYQ